MLSVPDIDLSNLSNPHAHRVPFVRQVPLNDRTETPLRLVRDEGLQSHIFSTSCIRALRYCSKRFPCKRRICPWCASRIATATRQAIRPTAKTFPEVVTWVSSTKSHMELASAWRAQGAARNQFLKGQWLTKRCAAWTRDTEITLGAGGWHVHDHWLLFLNSSQPSEFPPLATALGERWACAAQAAGVDAAPKIHEPCLTPLVIEKLNYATKGFMKNGKPGAATPADLLALYRAGDADAAERWGELERLFSKRQRVHQTGGLFRGQRHRPSFPGTLTAEPSDSTSGNRN